MSFEIKAGESYRVLRDGVITNIVPTGDGIRVYMGPKESYFDKAIKQIVEMHHKKASDYTDTNEFANFIESAEASGIETYQAIENLIGTKESRIRVIRRKMKEGKDVNNEPLLDSYLDRAVYALIQYAYQLKQEEDKNAVKPYFTGETIVANPIEQDKITYTQGLDPSFRYDPYNK